MWLIIISSNLNLTLRLLFQSNNNNLTLKICCKNCVHISFLKKKVEWICGNDIVEIGEEKKISVGLWQCHCWNRGKIFVPIVAIALPK